MSYLSQSRIVRPQLTHKAELLLQSLLLVANLTSHSDSG